MEASDSPLSEIISYQPEPEDEEMATIWNEWVDGLVEPELEIESTSGMEWFDFGKVEGELVY